MTKIFFEDAEDANRVAENLDVEKDCEHSITTDKEEIRVAISQERINRSSYSIAEVEATKPE